MKKNRFVAILLASSISTPLLFSADALEKFRQGVDKFKGGDYAASQKELSEFIKEHPYEVEVKKSWYYLARIAAAQKKYKDAIERINITLSRYPRHEDRVELNVLLGECLYEVNAHAHAEKVLQSVRTSAKDEALLYRLEKKLGFIAYAARRDAKTVEHLKAALRLAEKNAPHDSELFNVYATLGKVTAKERMQTEDAVRYLKEAIRLAGKANEREAKTLTILAQKLSLKRLDNKNGLGDNNTADIRVDGDDVYIATWGAGLYRYTRSTDTMKRIQLPSPQLRGLYVDFDEIFITSFDGVYRLSKKDGTVASLKDESGELKLGQKTIKDDRYIYFTTLTRGLVQYDTIKKKIQTFGKNSWVGSNQVYALDADLTYIVVGTIDHGVKIHNKLTGETVSLGVEENGLRSANIKAALIDGRYVYIGAHDDGVYVYDMKEKKLSRLPVDAPFPSALAKRENEILIGTSGEGVRIFSRNNNRVEKLRAIEGLSSNEVQIIRVEGDFLWIGYLEKGIDVFFLPSHEPN